MTNIQKPLLAGTVKSVPELSTLSYPLYVSAKLDGVRCMVVNGQPISRSGKILPNIMVQSFFANCKELEGLDGELIIGDPTDKKVFSKTTSGIMSEKGNPEFYFYVFDHLDSANLPFNVRYAYCTDAVKKSGLHPFVQVLQQVLVHKPDDVLALETMYLQSGYEGVILRHPAGRYKNGRSTAKEQIMLKFKRFEDSEAEILEVLELMVNNNVATTDAFGHTERSSHKENMTPGNTMGALKVKDIKTGVVFQIGTGFDDAQRLFFWKNRMSIVGKFIKYKHFPIGAVDAPRFPAYLGLRDMRDMS